MPIAIDGTPVNTSAPNLSTAATRDSDLARKNPTSTPTGMAMTPATPSMMREPTIAFEMPPPGIPAGVGRCVKNPPDHAAMPRWTV